MPLVHKVGHLRPGELKWKRIKSE